MEIWLPVLSIPGVEASNLGRIRCVSYEQSMPHGGTRTRTKAPTYGVLSYSVKGASHQRMIFRFRGRTYKIARAVCEAFHGAPTTGAPNVLHRDEDGLNNRPENLKWGTQKENLNAPLFRSERCAGKQRRAA